MPVFVKICGITNLADALVAARAGADMLGFILYERSPRYVSPASARALVRGLHAELGAQANMPRLVGVFVNQPPDAVARVLAFTGLDAAQLHGDETPADLRSLAGRAYKAIRPQPDARDWATWLEYAASGLAPGPSLLFDAFATSAYGGTGNVADWTLAASLAQRVPGLLLAGGLTPDNVADAVASVQPWGVDVSSGLEAGPGVKDHAALVAFITYARSAAA